jgi:hypothetical protein
MKAIRYLAVCTGFALLLASGWSSSARAQGPSANVSVFATGLNNPSKLLKNPNLRRFSPAPNSSAAFKVIALREVAYCPIVEINHRTADTGVDRHKGTIGS